MEYRGFFDVPQPWENETGSRQTLHNKTASAGLIPWTRSYGGPISRPDGGFYTRPYEGNGRSVSDKQDSERRNTPSTQEVEGRLIIRPWWPKECRGDWLTIRVPDNVVINPSLGTSSVNVGSVASK